MFSTAGTVFCWGCAVYVAYYVVGSLVGRVLRFSRRHQGGPR